jgi:hypothetical protein
LVTYLVTTVTFAIHGAADGRRAAGYDTPIGRVSVLGNLTGTEKRRFQMRTADHCETVGVIEDGGARINGHGSLAGIEQVPVFLTGRWSFPKVKNAILSVKDCLTAGGLIAGSHFQKADAEMDVGGVSDVLGSVRGDLRIAEAVSSLMDSLVLAE